MRRLILLLGCLAILVSACTLPFGRAPAVETAAPATPTEVGVPLPPAWTPTPLGQAEATVRPTSTVAVEPSATPAIEVSALRLAELPAGFMPAQPIAYGLSPAALSAGLFRPQALSMFEDPSTGTLVISVASLLASPSEEQAVTQGIETPTTLIEVLAGVLGPLEGTPRVLDGYNDIGTASAAAEGRILFRSFRYDVRIVLFRQGPIAAYLGLMEPLGARTEFELDNVVRQYAARLQVSTIIGAPTIPAR